MLGFFMVQLSHPYITTGKTIALPRQTLVGKITYLLLTMLSRLMIAFLSVILEPKNIKSVTDSIISPSFCHEGMGLDAMILVF